MAFRPLRLDYRLGRVVSKMEYIKNYEKMHSRKKRRVDNVEKDGGCRVVAYRLGA